jgi:hypothetical protein
MLNTALLDTLTGNRDYQFAQDVDDLASAADAINFDHNNALPMKADYQAFKVATLPIDKDCYTTLAVPPL